METGARLKRMGVSLKEVDNLQALPRPFYDVRDEIGSEMGLLNLWKGRYAIYYCRMISSLMDTPGQRGSLPRALGNCKRLSKRRLDK